MPRPNPLIWEVKSLPNPNFIFKNYDNEQSLHDLHEYLPDTLPFSNQGTTQAVDDLSSIPKIPDSRNENVFNEVSFYACRAKELFNNFNQFLSHIKKITLKITKD